MTTAGAIEELRGRARTEVDAVWDDEGARYRMREAFYERWGKSDTGGVGIGKSELDFMRWEMQRGVLRAPTRGGSHWWRKVNGGLLFDARLAELVLDHAPSLDPGTSASRHWMAFMRSSDGGSWPKLWYRAHNTSIASGYIAAVREALDEPYSERVFVNMVLYRVLYAQALVEGEALGLLGRMLADPRTPSVEALLHLPGYYPDRYPMTAEEVRDVQARGHALGADLLDLVLDDVLILPELDRLYAHAATWTDLPEILNFVANNRPDYPPG
jgi:hypothetical protein